MRWRWILGLLFGQLIIYTNAQFTAVIINNRNNSGASSTEAPVTGKLSQFKGFHTPRPFPPNANFMYASVWASWSAWSFCTGKVQVRVRACNTVRGYSCPGPNRETKPCDILPPRQNNGNGKKSNTDYDVNDPWDADRREALKQLYNDYDSSTPESKQKPQNQEFRRQLSGGKTAVESSPNSLSGPPLRPLGRAQAVNSNGETAHAPSMTPELLYERKPVADVDIPIKKPLAFASKNTKEAQNIIDTSSPPPKDELISPRTTMSTKPASLVDQDAKNKALNTKLRDNQSVSSSVVVNNGPRINEWNSGPANRPGRPSNRQPFTRIPPQNPTAFPQQFTQTTSRFVPSTFVPKPTTTQAPQKGDQVQISSSVQQHFNNATNQDGTVLSSINELKLRDSNVTEGPSIQSNIKEEPLSTALETDQPNSSDSIQHEIHRSHLHDKDSHSQTWTRPVVARRPTQEEIEKMANRLEKAQLSGDAGKQLKSNLHSGEIVHEKSSKMNDETAKALEWMLRNMSDATKITPESASEQMVDLNLDAAARSSSSENLSPVKISNLRVFASKTLPEGRLSKEHVGQISRSATPNPDEEGKQLESELSALKESMKQMETELNELREAELENQKPRFNVRKAENLNLVPKAPRQLINQLRDGPKSTEKPSELFLLDHFEHRSSAHWSNWSPYGECFCNKRIRTRNCIYDDPAHSEGCEGKSYESVRCIGGTPCPSERKKLAINRRSGEQAKSSTIVGHFNPTTGHYRTFGSTLQTTEQPPHGDLFYPNPLPMARRQFF